MSLGRLTAGIAVLGKTGATATNIEHNDEKEWPTKIGQRWKVTAELHGREVESAWYPYPDHAVTDVLGQVLNGGGCLRCGRTTVVDVRMPGFCVFELHTDDFDDQTAYEYRRSCETPSPNTVRLLVDVQKQASNETVDWTPPTAREVAAFVQRLTALRETDDGWEITLVQADL